MIMKTYKNTADYIADYPKEIQKLLKQMRAAIKKGAPKAKEAIKYGIPTFVQNGNLVHFGAFKTHVSFFPGSPGVRTKFKTELAKYDISKGTVRFPLDKRLPLGLITKITKLRVKEDALKGK